MMNRRLRERLTEAEILQIFVDVCEGVAAMHHLRPALLHRDLKVSHLIPLKPNHFSHGFLGRKHFAIFRLPLQVM